MIDGININYTIPNFEVWRQAVPFHLLASVETFETGLISTKKRGEKTITLYRSVWETFKVLVKQVTYKGQNIYYLNLKGSLHKNYFGGTNYLPFTWQHLQSQIKYVCETLHIDPLEAKINGLEIGVNVWTPFQVHPFIMQNIIDYKGDPFIRYRKDANGICLGKVCDNSQYSVKIYNKGLQYKLSQNLIRYELKYFKMQPLKPYGIYTLSDLQNFDKVNKLSALLFAAWNEVLIYDILQPINKLQIKQNQKDLLRDGRNGKFWERLKKEKNSDQFKYLRNKFKKTVLNFGSNLQLIAAGLIANEWETLSNYYPNLPMGESIILPEFTIKIKGKNGEKINTPNKRYCLTCNKELHPDQKKESKYCSSKIVGEKLAHHCRNANSNPRNNFKKKVDVISRRGILFDILPYFDIDYQILNNQNLIKNVN